eukprot:scaffold6.g2749.t1
MRWLLTRATESECISSASVYRKPLLSSYSSLRLLRSTGRRTLTSGPGTRDPGVGMSQQIGDALSKLDLMIASASSGVAPASAAPSPVAAPAAAADGAAAAGAKGDGVGSIRAELGAAFGASLAAAFPQLAGEKPAVAQCNNPQHGDYQCNNAMAVFGKLKGKEGAPKAPRAVAEALVAHLPAGVVGGLVAETSLAGPGFINVRVSRDWLAAHVTSSPNVAKEMHVGHLRSTIIGDTVARSLEYCSADVLRLNHIGDWGTQFGMLIQVLYRAAKARFDEEEAFKTRAREAVTALQGGKPEYLEASGAGWYRLVPFGMVPFGIGRYRLVLAWRRICGASRGEFQKIYDRLGVTLQERGESFYNPLLKGVVEDLLARGIAEESEGAICVFVEGQQIPLIVRKSDGGFGYASTDMAAIRHRIEDEKADWLIYITDAGQSQHFDLVFAGAKKAGYLPGVFNQFYTECQVVGSPQEDSRLLLAEATAVVMRQCFHLLGITTLYRI